MKLSVPLIPASFFAMTLGLAETGNAWRFAVQLWHIPAAAGEVLEILAALSFIVFIALYIYKWRAYRQAALNELRDPVQSAFIALIPEALILLALAWQPYYLQGALGIFWIGSIANLLFAVMRLAAHWTTQREAIHIVPPLFLPYTASVLVNALAAGVFGYTDYGWMLFGIGVMSWFILDGTIAQQLMTGGLAEKTRNFMGIYSAPPVIALVAYQILSGNDVDRAISHALAGYAIFIFAGLLCAARWLARQPFAPGYWAYTFGLATLAQGLMLMAGRSDSAVLHGVAAAAFAASVLLLVSVAFGSARLLARRAYFPPLAPAA